MIFRISIFCLCTFISGISAAQILRVEAEADSDNLFSSYSIFNKKFIKTNRIKAINGKRQQKEQLKPIKELGLVYNYTFNNQGNIESQFETYYKKGKEKDTAIVHYEYDEKNRLKLKRTSDGSGFFSYMNEYDANSKISKQTYARDENAGSKSDFKLKRRIIVTEQSYWHEKLGPQQHKKHIVNDIGKEYKSVVFTYDKFNNLTEKSYQFAITGKRGTTQYQYNELMLLSKWQSESKIIKQITNTHEFIYDDIGNLLSEKISRNGKLKTTKEFLYDKNMLLSAQLTKDEATGTIYIIKYSYEFYD